MKSTARYLTHPQVNIDPSVSVEKWSLNDVGRQRVIALANSAALRDTRRVISSTETKAIETAQPIAESLGVELRVQEQMQENDRSATGFLVPDEFEKAADQFFAEPTVSFKGWETAVDAQKRIVATVQMVLSEKRTGDVLFLGHGGVGTLLMCSLLGEPISRKWDQPAGGGQYFEFDIESREVLTRWMPLEHLCK